MAGINSQRTLSAIEFVETATRERAVSYREHAQRLSILAEAEPNRSLRNDLLELARRYEDLAARLEASRPG